MGQMSAKSRAIMTAESKNEWNWFLKDMMNARREYNLDLAKAKEKSDSRSGIQRLLGSIFFTIAAVGTIATGGKILPWVDKALKGWKLAAAASTAGALTGTTVSGLTAEVQKDYFKEGGTVGELMAGSEIPEEYMEDVHMPLYGKSRAEYEVSAFEGDVETDMTTLDDWYENAWGTALAENVGRGSSFMAATWLPKV